MDKHKRVTINRIDFTETNDPALWVIKDTSQDWRVFGYNGKRFVAYFWFIDWCNISMGISLYLSAPNIEIHLPFGFIKIGVPSKPVVVYYD